MYLELTDFPGNFVDVPFDFDGCDSCFEKQICIVVESDGLELRFCNNCIESFFKQANNVFN